MNSIRAVLKNKKYMGVYHYNGKEYPDAYIPALIDAETFDKVQRMLVQNRKAPAKKWTKAEYLLTGKLFCGLCGQTMIGESGTGKSGTRYHYYNCLGKKNHRTCKKRAVRKSWIEELVLAKAKAVVMSDEMIDFIAQKTYDYYVEQNTDTSYTDSLHAELERVNTATANLIRAMEAGIFNDATRTRMEELEAQKGELEVALADAELISGLRLTQEHIKFFLLQFRQLDFDEPNSQRRIIDIFINAVFVYDDKVTITFNYSGDNRTITLAEVDAAAQGVHGLSGMGHQLKNTRHRSVSGPAENRALAGIFSRSAAPPFPAEPRRGIASRQQFYRTSPNNHQSKKPAEEGTAASRAFFRIELSRKNPPIQTAYHQKIQPPAQSSTTSRTARSTHRAFRVSSTRDSSAVPTPPAWG